MIVPAYVLIEQGVGIAYVLEDFYGSSFRIVSFLSVLIATGFVFFGGMKAVLREEQFTAVVLLAAFAAGVVFVLWTQFIRGFIIEMSHPLQCGSRFRWRDLRAARVRIPAERLSQWEIGPH